jgi:predicted glycosyltransferase
MKIVYYCQHIWGVGHFFRSLEICKALVGHDIVMVVGGPDIDTPLPAHVQLFRLPGLMTDRHYNGLFPVDRGKTLEAVKAERRDLLFRMFAREAADIFIVELYPFGRKAFRFELDPILEGIRKGSLPPSKVVCSIRDILVEKKDPVAYEDRVVGILNRWYDLLLIHADPNLVELDRTFSCLGDVSIPVTYTGYIAPNPPVDAGSQARSAVGVGDDVLFIVASAGGGQAGIVLLEPLVDCFPSLNTGRPAVLHVYTGPYMPDDEFARLRKRANEFVKIERFTSDFLPLLATADLSISMAGYNTSMNILATKVPALVWPYPGDREQGIRAERLDGIGAATVLKERDLQPDRLAAVIRDRLARGRARIPRIDLDGAAQTARYVEQLYLRDFVDNG